jgi:hypothetical protein
VAWRARAPFLILAGVAVCISVALAATVGGSARGYALFGGSALLGGLFTAWLIARKTSDPVALGVGAIFVAGASFAALVLVIYVIFGIAEAGD